MSIAEKLTKIAENVPKVYEAGKKSEYDTFWDNVIDSVDNSSTQYCFCGKVWNNTTFHPNKDLVVPNWCQRYFNHPGNLDVKARLAEKNLKLDLFSKCKNIIYLVEYGDGLTALPELDTRNISDLQYFIYYCADLVSIDKVILKDDGTQMIANTSFGRNSALTHVIFEGCIGQSFNIAQSPLDAESAKSIINCLKNYSGTDKEFAYTLSLSSTAKANLEALGNTAPDGLTWLEYAQSKGWNT